LPGTLRHLAEDARFARSIDALATGEGFGLLGVDAAGEGAALGLASMYALPMENRTALGVEALCFRDRGLPAQRPLWTSLVELAATRGAGFVLVARRGLNTPEVLNELVALRRLDGYRVDVKRPAMQRPSGTASYSGLTGEPVSWRAFEPDPLVRIATVRVPAEGVRYGGGPLYRGEGRLVCSEWSVRTLRGLREHCRRRGFPARFPDPVEPAARFTGALGQQILHQGGVPVGAVSFSTSREVAAYYATRGGQQDGIVFTVDQSVLAEAGPLYDAYQSMVQSCDWFGAGEFATLVEIVRALDVKDAGRFLEQCYAGSRTRLLEGGVSDWGRYLGGSAGKLAASGIERRRLDELQDALERYWQEALEIASDDIHVVPGGGDPVVRSRPARLLTYDDAFRQVAPRLRGVKAPDPGWDLTPFGYIAKTCRDREVFAAGSAPPACILEATTVKAPRR
jgi:hypothetical protein